MPSDALVLDLDSVLSICWSMLTVLETEVRAHAQQKAVHAFYMLPRTIKGS